MSPLGPQRPLRLLNATKSLLKKLLRFDGLDSNENDRVVRLAFFLALCAVGLRLFFWWYTDRIWEDALITVLHSENFVNGLGMTHYRVGQPPLHGFTSPLSVLVPLVGDLFKSGFGLSFIRLVSAFAGGLTVLYAMAIAIHPAIRLPAALAALVMGYLTFEHHQILWGMAGMETQMVTLVLLMAAYYAIARKPIALGISLGLCMLARPDFAFWTVIVGAYLLLFDRKALWKAMLVAVAVYAPWIVFTTLYYGSPIPNTLVAKGLGYPLWSSAPGVTWHDIVRNVTISLFDSYSSGAIFQPLGPCFAGHGGGFRPLLHDHGLICNAMVVLAGVGIVAAIVRRQWAFLPIIAFILTYAGYYIFFVPIIFGWYVVPFVAMTIFCSARGLQMIGGLLPMPRVRQAAFAGLTLAYLSSFVVFLPKTFATEKRIQEDVENQVRKQVGLFLAQVMDQDQTVGCEPLGYIAYYSRRTVYDWPGLASREVVEYSRSHPNERSLMGMLKTLRPDFIVLRYCEYEDSFAQTWIDNDYRVIASFEAPRAAIRDIFDVRRNVDLGFLVLARMEWNGGSNVYKAMTLGVNPHHAGAYNSEAFRFLKQGRTEEAQVCIQESLRLDPGSAEAHNTCGLLFVALNQFDEALPQFQEALHLDPAYALPYNNLAALLLRRGDYEGALAHLRAAIQADPEYVQGYNNLANLLASRGDYVGAQRAFEHALEITPRDKDATAGLEKVRAALAGSPMEPR